MFEYNRKCVGLAEVIFKNVTLDLNWRNRDYEI